VEDFTIFVAVDKVEPTAFRLLSTVLLALEMIALFVSELTWRSVVFSTTGDKLVLGVTVSMTGEPLASAFTEGEIITVLVSSVFESQGLKYIKTMPINIKPAPQAMGLGFFFV
jgi:hypothetical protein